MRIDELVTRFDDQLRTADFADLDPSANGLQIGDADAPVDHVAFAVDAARGPIQVAAEAGVEVLCVHHGLIWNGLDRLTGRTYDRIAELVKGDVALYTTHLPLDAHPELGNAAGVASVLDLEAIEPFGALGQETVGLQGRLADGPVSAERLADRLASGLTDSDHDIRTLSFGHDDIEAVAIVTGSGADWFEEAAEAGLDAFVTGEGKQSLYHQAREADTAVVLGGHYATETFGVQSLQSLATEWGLETTFIDWPTGF